MQTWHKICRYWACYPYHPHKVSSLLKGKGELGVKFKKLNINHFSWESLLNIWSLNTVIPCPTLFKEVCKPNNSKFKRTTLFPGENIGRLVHLPFVPRDDAQEKATHYRGWALLLDREQTQTRPGFQKTFPFHKAGDVCVPAASALATSWFLPLYLPKKSAALF